MRAFTSDTLVLPLPAAHRFPMAKYRRLRERVEAELPQIQLDPAAPVGRAELLRAHTVDYVDRALGGQLTAAEVRVLGFPQIPELPWRERHSVGGTLDAARAALTDGVAANLAGGTHHAGPARPQGYCLFNDAAVAIRALQAEGLGRAAVIDLDVHQGNGTAEIFAGDASVFTLSVHGEKNFPFHKVPSDLDVALPDHTRDDAYLAAVQSALDVVFAHRPELVIYNAGVDVFVGDKLGRLDLTAGGVAARDRLVIGRCRSEGAPVACVMGGGYAPDLEQIVELHLVTLSESARG